MQCASISVSVIETFMQLESTLMSHFNEQLPVLVKSAFQSNITGWSNQNLSKRDLKLLTKAFDKVSHIKLISKLKAYGINGKLLDWIIEWIHQRTQRLSIRGVSSDWINVLSEVPQGSVLGPVLFLIFISDLDFGIKSWLLKFADDTKIFNRVNCTADVESLQMDLHTLITGVRGLRNGRCCLMWVNAKLCMLGPCSLRSSVLWMIRN